MFTAWLVQTDVVSLLVNLFLLVAGIILVLAFLALKHPALLVGGVILLIIRFTNLYDHFVGAVWTWVFIAGVAAVAFAGTIGAIRSKNRIGRTAIALTVVFTAVGAFFVVTG